MLSFHLPLNPESTKCQDYCLDAQPVCPEQTSFKVKISLKEKCLDLYVDSGMSVTWKPEAPSQEIPTAANSDTVEAQTPETIDLDGGNSVSRGPPLSYDLTEFNNGECLQPNILHITCAGPSRFFKLMILIDNYLRPHSRDGELDDSSISLLDRWSRTFPKTVQLGLDILAELANAYASEGSDLQTRVFISDLAAKVYARAKEWIEDLWVGELEQFHAFCTCYDEHPVNFEEEFVQAAENARLQLQLAALECELAECMIGLDADEDLPESLINVAVWISQFNGPLGHLMSYVKEVCHGFDGEQTHDLDEEDRLNMMNGMRGEVLHLIRCRMLRSILKKDPKWLLHVDGTEFANILRCGAMDFHCAYACHMFSKSEETASEFLRSVALAGTKQVLLPSDMKSLIENYTLEDLLHGYDATRAKLEPTMDLEVLWRTSRTVAELAWRFAAACK